jgi:eukaryotic-like serine/threonine-protein kinase
MSRRSLAALNHPNIGRLYDGGVSETGLPYLVMEYVEGVPVTTYCDDNKLDLDQRLDIFLDICRAVEHAHRNLIVHRDLKPGNILVTPDGHVKLLDFGIAKLLDDQIIAPDDQVHTREDSRVMTPDYASPEQIMGKPVSTASDVYALGVLLHELLTGVRPHRFAGMSKLEIERRLESTSLTRPSQRVGESPEASIYRSKDWVHHLYGDLDSIVMMALRIEQERTNQIAGFLSGLFSELNPNQSLGEDISARELLDRGAERIGITLRDQPLSQSDILMAIGGVYFNIFDMDKALDAYSRSFAIRDSMLGPADIRTAESQYWIARAHAELAQYDLADSLYQSAGTKFAGVDHPNARWQRFRAIGDRALVYRLQGDTDAAEPLFLESIAGLRSELGNMHVELARMLNNYSILLNDKGRYQESADFISEALNINRTVTGDVNTDVMRDMTNLAANKVYLGQIAEADSLFARAQELANQLLPPTHSVRATIMNNRASLLIMLDKPVEAEALYNDVIDLRLQTVGENHPLTGIARMGLANALISQQRFADAGLVAKQSIATMDASLPPTHWAHNAVRAIQAIAKHGSGDEISAAALMDANFPALLEARGAKDAVVRRAARVYATIESSRGNTDRSTELLRIAEGESAQDSP